MAHLVKASDLAPERGCWTPWWALQGSLETGASLCWHDRYSRSSGPLPQAATEGAPSLPHTGPVTGGQERRPGHPLGRSVAVGVVCV